MLSVLDVHISYQTTWVCVPFGSSLSNKPDANIQSKEIIVALSAFTKVEHLILSIGVYLPDIKIMDPLISIASAKALFQELTLRTNGGCFRKQTLHITLLAHVPGTPYTRPKKLTLRCKASERDDRPEEIVIDVEDKEADHWRRVKEEWEPGSHEWMSCEALERAVSAGALVKKYQEVMKAREEKERKKSEHGTEQGVPLTPSHPSS